MRALPSDLVAVAISQGGLISRRQALTFIDEDTLKYLLRAGGPWQRVIRGVYATFTGTLTVVQRRRAALAYAGENTMLTGLEGCRALGLRYVPRDDDIQVLVHHARHRQSRDFVVIERTWRMPERHILRNELPVAPAARCVLDACRRMTAFNAVQALMADSVQQEKATPAQLHEELELGPVNGSALPRHCLERLILGARSGPEGDVVALFQSSQILPMAHHNCTLEALDGKFLAITDGYIEDVGLASEVNSMEWHLNPDERNATDERQVRLGVHGVLVLPVAPSRLKERGADYLREVEAAYVKIQAWFRGQ